jgi:hypothetical protein
MRVNTATQVPEPPANGLRTGLGRVPEHACYSELRWHNPGKPSDAHVHLAYVYVHTYLDMAYMSCTNLAIYDAWIMRSVFDFILANRTNCPQAQSFAGHFDRRPSPTFYPCVSRGSAHGCSSQSDLSL